jgi:TolB-like protein
MPTGLAVRVFLSNTLLVAAGCSMYEFKDPTGAQMKVAYETPEQSRTPTYASPRQRQPEQLELIAVLEVEDHSERVTLQEAQFITDTIRSKAADRLDRRRFTVMTRENMDIIIPPEKRWCTNEACYAVIGKTLQAKYVLGGRLTDVAGQIALTLEIYESRTGQLLGSELARAKDVGAILDAVGDLAQRLFSRIMAP